MKNRKHKVIAIIPARGGSKGIKNKNIVKLIDKPLIAYTIQCALKCPLIDRVIVSTDDNKIERVAIKCGAEVPFIRPKGLAKDTSPSIDVLRHAVKWLESETSYSPDIVVYLQPTDIFRTDKLLTEVIRKLINNRKLDTVFAAYPTHKNFWKKTKSGYRLLASGIDQSKVRQHKEPIYREDAGLASATRAKLIKKGIKIGKNVDIVTTENFETSIDIHEPFDIWIASEVLKKRKNYYGYNK